MEQQKRMSGVPGRAIATIAVLMCALIVQGSSQRASAQPILNSANGHYYESVSAPGLTWEQANAAAQARSFQGTAGHLATITSAAENDFIVGSFPSATGSGYWLGGFQAAGGVEPAGGWQWVTLEPFTYTNWAPNQPNNFFGQENRLHFLSNGQWDDTASTIEYTGYVVEYDTGSPIPTATPTPIPTNPPAGTLRIIGRITDANANPLQNVSVTRAGNVTVLTNSAGYYTFNGLANGTYTVTPTLNGVNFTPTSRTVALNGSDATGQNFVGRSGPLPQPTFSVSGRVSNSSGTQIPGVNVTATLQGAPGTTVTIQSNNAGYYTFNGLAPGTYLIAPSASGLNFTPESRTVTVTNSNLAGLNFIGSSGPPPAPTFSVSGRVSNSNGDAIPNITVVRTGTGQTTTTTNSAGFFTFTNVPNGNYTITPNGQGLDFSPPSRSVTVSGANLANQNFIGGPAAATFSFNGRITDTSGNPLQNVAVTREGNITVFTNNAGYYTFAGLPAGTYTVTPALQGVSFTPTTRTATITNTNVIGQNFVGSSGALPPATFSVSGRVSTSNGTAIPGVNVTATLQGGPGTTVAVQTNSAGYFTFNGLPRGTYVLSINRSGFSFTPETRTVIVDNANIAGQNFIGSGAPG